MLVEFLASTLDFLLVFQKDKCETCLLALAHLDNDGLVINVEVCKEIFNVLLARLVGDTTKFNAAMQVLFV